MTAPSRRRRKARARCQTRVRSLWNDTPPFTSEKEAVDSEKKLMQETVLEHLGHSIEKEAAQSARQFNCEAPPFELKEISRSEVLDTEVACMEPEHLGHSIAKGAVEPERRFDSMTMSIILALLADEYQPNARRVPAVLPARRPGRSPPTFASTPL